MTTDGLRRLRVVFKFGLLVSLPVAGYLWAQTGTSALTVTSKDEKIRQMDRIVETLSNQNHDLRGKLISLHGEVHRAQDGASELPAQDGAAEAEPTGDVTDLSTLRNRR